MEKAMKKFFKMLKKNSQTSNKTDKEKKREDTTYQCQE